MIPEYLADTSQFDSFTVCRLRGATSQVATTTFSSKPDCWQELHLMGMPPIREFPCTTAINIQYIHIHNHKYMVYIDIHKINIDIFEFPIHLKKKKNNLTIPHCIPGPRSGPPWPQQQQVSRWSGFPLKSAAGDLLSMVIEPNDSPFGVENHW